MDNNIKIFGVKYNDNKTEAAEIESVILSGIYKFSILGMNQKNISELKDRIYSSLRTQKLINLKSHNKRITVNVSPYDNGEVTNNYDLGIALSCLFSMRLINYHEDILATGRLSILGNVNSNKNILSTIYTAITHNIKTICCSHEDIQFIKNKIQDISSVLIKHDIKFISGNTLDELNQNIKNNQQVDLFSKKIKQDPIIKYNINNLPDEIDEVIFLLCTKNNILIEKTNENNNLYNFIKNLIFYRSRLSLSQLLNFAGLTNIDDEQILLKYTTPYINNIQTHNEKDYDKYLFMSKFGFNLIENIKNLDRIKLLRINQIRASSMLAFYTTCPCGTGEFFFNQDSKVKCFCIQRNILRYRNNIRLLSEDIFDVIIKNNIYAKIYHNDISSEAFININKFILDFDSNSKKINVNIEDRYMIDKIEYIKSFGFKDENLIKKIFNTSIEYEKFLSIKSKNDIEEINIINTKTLDKIINLFKKDF